jgi:hypothetical protein
MQSRLTADGTTELFSTSADGTEIYLGAAIAQKESPMFHWAQICAAVGIDPRNLSLMDAYLLSGKVQKHDLLRHKKLEDLSDEEKTKVRDDVLGVIPIVGKKP